MSVHPRFRSLAASVAVCLGTCAAVAAPPREVHVLQLASGREQVEATIRLTKALEQQALKASDAKLVNSNRSLLDALRAAKCGQPFVQQALRATGPLAESGASLDDVCLGKVAVALEAPYGRAERFVWGYLHAEPGGALLATAHLWQSGRGVRQVTLPYRGSVDALAERLFLHLWRGPLVGDVQLVAERPLEGDLLLGGQSRGPFDANEAAFTVPLGDVEALVRREGKVLARGRASVGVSGVTTLRLEPIAEPATAPPAPRVAPTEGPRTTPTTPAVPHETSALPWVFGGVGVAGLVGAGVFFGLRQGEQSELKKACGASLCPSDQGDAVDRGKLYGTLSLVSLGVGAVGAGLLTYTLLRDDGASATSAARSPRVVGRVYPLVGGLAAGVGGRF